jgi:hypothetical protein
MKYRNKRKDQKSARIVGMTDISLADQPSQEVRDDTKNGIKVMYTGKVVYVPNADLSICK